MVVSMAATTPIEDVIAAAGGRALWFQLYPQPDPEFTAAVVRRAERAGCRALVVTVDSPVLRPPRTRPAHGFNDLPAGLVCENMRDDTGRVRAIVMDAELGWDRIDWLRGITGLPIVLKGVLHPADAELAVEHGVSALLVSNHGGRQLDGVLATVDALPRGRRGRRRPAADPGGRRHPARRRRVWPRSRSGAAAVLVGRPCSGGSPRTAATGCGRCSTCCARTWTGRSRWPGSRARPT